MNRKLIEVNLKKTCISEKKVHWGTCGTVLNNKVEPIAEWAEFSWDMVKIIGRCK